MGVKKRSANQSTPLLKVKWTYGHLLVPVKKLFLVIAPFEVDRVRENPPTVTGTVFSLFSLQSET